LPLSGRPKLYLENVDPSVAQRYGEVVQEIGSADLALVRLATPFEPRDQYPLEAFFHSGSLAFAEAELSRVLDILNSVPSVVDIFLERPAVIPEIAAASAALTGSFGANDAAWLDVLFGRFAPAGKLPFELPSSMDAVRDQKPDLPHDSVDPLFPFGHGLTYGE
jgi:beta-glucosidase